MTPSSPSASRLFKRLKRGLHALQRSLLASLQAGLPAPAPRLVPIPIRVDRHDRGQSGQRIDRRG